MEFKLRSRSVILGGHGRHQPRPALPFELDNYGRDGQLLRRTQIQSSGYDIQVGEGRVSLV